MSGNELVLYTHPMSRGRIARWMLEEVGAPYRTEYLVYGGSMHGAAFKALNPMGKVPALVHGDVVVTETAAICCYLADRFPAAGLAPPAESEARGAYYRWMFFAAGPFEAALVNTALGVEVPPEKQAFVGYGSKARVLETLEAALAGRTYLVGDRFSAADVYVGAQIGFGLRFKTIDPRPAFVTYWEGLKDRPAAVRAREIDDALLPAEQRGI